MQGRNAKHCYQLEQNRKTARASLILPEGRIQMYLRLTPMWCLDETTIFSDTNNRWKNSFHLATPTNAVQSYPVVPIQLDNTTSTVLVQIQGVKRTHVLDSGSCCNKLQPGVADEPIGCTDFAPFVVTGKNLEVQREQTIKFLMGSVTSSHIFVVCKLPN